MRIHAARRFAFWSKSALFLILVALVMFPGVASAASSDIVISQVYGGGGGAAPTYKNDYIELFNRGTSPVSVNGWSVQYGSATGTSTWTVTALPNVSIPAGGYFLIQEGGGAAGATLPTPDATGTINMAAGSAKVAVVSNTTALTGACPGGWVDLVGYGTANCSETTAVATLSQTLAALRNNNGCTDTDNNSTDFTVTTPSPRNSATATNSCAGGSTAPTGVGDSNPASGIAGSTTLLTVTVTSGTNPASSGITVAADLTAIGGSATQTFYDDGTNGDVTGGDNVFSFNSTVGSVAAGAKSMTATISDAQLRSSTASIPFVVELDPTAIHDVQGSGNTSPFAGQVVTTTGIVTAIKNNGFFMQTPDLQADSDTATSEGVFVFTSSAPPAAAAVGNAVRVTGNVSEYIPSADPNSPPMTEITSPAVVVESTGNSLPAAITLTSADTDPAGNVQQLEKYEGMRVTVDSLTVSGPTQGTVNEPNATSTSNGTFYGVITGIPRPFREPGIDVSDPLPGGSPCCIPRFDANPERLRVDSDAQTGATAIEVTSGAIVTGITGVVDYGYRTYTILPDPSTPPGVSGNATYTAVPPVLANEATVASFNMQRFFDTTNDPNIGEPVLTALAFSNRLNKASLAIRTVLETPDILGVEEIENLSTLQAIASKVNADAVANGDPDPAYVAYLEEGNDIGGIDVGFLVKSSRVTVVDVTQFGKDTTYINPLTGLPEMLNDRPPLVLRARIEPAAGVSFPITVIANHLRSLSGIDDSVDGPRVRAKRAAQAEYLASLIDARQTADPTEMIVSVGDYNAYEFNDGYVDSLGTIKGTPTPADQVVLASPDLCNPDLTDLITYLPADQRYSFLYDGNGQMLDHELITANLTSHLDAVTVGRNNADFPDSYRNDPNRPERLSDHDMPVVYIHVPGPVDHLSASASTATPTVSVPFDVTITARDANGDAATGYTGTVHFTSNGSVTMPSDYTFTLADQGVRTVSVTADTPGPLQITATDTGNALLTASVDVTVACDSSVSVTASNSGPYCEGSTVELSATTIGGATYSWTGPDGFTSTEQNPTIASATPVKSGDYTVTATVGACSYDSTTTVTVNSTAAPVITATSCIPVGSTGLTANVADHAGSSYAWTLTGGSIVTGQGTSQITYDPGPAGTLVTLAVTETPSSSCVIPQVTKKLLVDFNDVPPSNAFHDYVCAIGRHEVTLGCAAGEYCPNNSVIRLQMAGFIARSMTGGDANVPTTGTVGSTPYNCSAGGNSLFADVAPTSFFCPHVHYIASQNITLGCDATHFCPNDSVSRLQMALFLARALAGSDAAVPSAYTDPTTGRHYDIPGGDVHFTDMPASNPFSKQAHYIWARGVSDGCTATNYCPNDLTSRLQMAKFLANAFNLQ